MIAGLEKADVKSQLPELSANSLETFCEDIAGMFGISMECSVQNAKNETSESLSKKFKKLASLFSVKSEGVLDDSFYVVIDREGLFTLAGTIVMMPQKRVTEIRRTGTLAEAENLRDAIGEIGNLLVGSCNRVFKEELEGHVHLLQTGTFLGVPWENPENNMGIGKTEEFLFVPFDMNVDSYSAFQGGMIFPTTLFLDKKSAEIDRDEAIPANVSEMIEPTKEPQRAEEPKTEAETAEPEINGTVITEEMPGAAAETRYIPEKTDTAASRQPSCHTGEELSSVMTAAVLDAKETSVQSASQAIQDMVRTFPVLRGDGTPAFLEATATDVMQREVLWISPEDTVQQVMAKMHDSDSGYMIVGTNGVIEGIVSWIDIYGAVSVYLRPQFAQWRRREDDDTLQIKIKFIMSRPVRTEKPNTTLEVLMNKMFQYDFRCLPIVDSRGQVQGMVTAFDIFRFLLSLNSGQKQPSKYVRLGKFLKVIKSAMKRLFHVS